MKNLVFLVEGKSEKAMLSALLPKFLPDDICITYFVFEGKTDLENNLKPRIRGWQSPNTAFIILRDQDSGDCELIKQRLLDLSSVPGRIQYLG